MTRISILGGCFENEDCMCASSDREEPQSVASDPAFVSDPSQYVNCGGGCISLALISSCLDAKLCPPICSSDSMHIIRAFTIEIPSDSVCNFRR